jgi:broad specificity phosphatase PhoE
MVRVIFESHSTTVDNEAHVSSGHADTELSELGLQQSKELGERYKNEQFAAIFCSDLQRSYKTAELAFDERFPIIKDARLRECDYGDMTRQASSEVDAEKAKRIDLPFPNGENYEQCTDRVGLFLQDLKNNFDGQTVMIIGHRATQYGLEHWLKAKSVTEAVTAPWKWQPGWEYELA